MPKLEDQMMEAFRKSGKKDLDRGIYLDPKETPNEELNKAIGAPKGTIIKPVKMPEYKADPDEEIDIGIGRKVRRGDLKPARMPILEKKGGVIGSSKSKVSTAKKNPFSSKW